MANSTKQRITETLEKNYMPYAMSVIVSRAIPEIDGFKPSHRKLLYTMYKMKLLSGQRTKSANVVGQTMKLNPHGDQAIYATMVRLTRGYDALVTPYVDSKGNFGKVTSRDMKYAAARYTEVKLDDICQELFKDIDKDMVDFIDSYDGKMKEPVLLPTTFPNVLINANKGIAVGMASSICSYNLKEVVDATIKFMDEPEFDIHEIVKGPDFSTGGYLVYKEKEIRNVLDNGLGSFKLRAKYRFDKENNLIEVFEIPYTTTVEAIIEKVVDHIKSGKIKEISDIRDETDISGLKITLDLKKGTDPDIMMSKLFKYTTLEDSFSSNFNILINGRPKVLGFKEVIDEWVKFRIGCIRRRTKFEIIELSDKLHLLSGLKKVLLDIDKAVRLVKDTEKDVEVVPNLVKAFEIDRIQGEFIADIKLRNMNKEYIIKRVAEVRELERRLEELFEIERSDEKIKSIIKAELNVVSKKYKNERKTEILYHDEIIRHEDVHEIEDFNLKFFLTEHGYIKKIPLTSLRSAGAHKLKDDDRIIQEVDGTNKDELLIFTDRCNCYKTRVHEIEDHKTLSLGIYIPNLIELEYGEKPIYIISTLDYNGEVLFGFENGKVAKVPLKLYETKTNRKKLVKAYSDLSPLVSMIFIREEEDLVFIRYSDDNEYTLSIADSSLIPIKVTKNTSGVQSLRMKKGSSLFRFKLLNDLKIHPSGSSSEESDNIGLKEEISERFKKFRSKKIPASGTKLDPVEVLEKRYDDILKK